MHALEKVIMTVMKCTFIVLLDVVVVVIVGMLKHGPQQEIVVIIVLYQRPLQKWTHQHRYLMICILVSRPL